LWQAQFRKVGRNGTAYYRPWYITLAKKFAEIEVRGTFDFKNPSLKTPASGDGGSLERGCLAIVALVSHSTGEVRKTGVLEVKERTNGLSFSRKIKH